MIVKLLTERHLEFLSLKEAAEAGPSLHLSKCQIVGNLMQRLKCLDPSILRPNKKKPVFRVTGPYLNLLVKPRFFSGFLNFFIILCILKGEMPFKMHKIIFLPEKIYVCLPYLKTYFYIWPYHLSCAVPRYVRYIMV